MLVTLQTARPPGRHAQLSFTRAELGAIVGLYSTCVSKGIWRDYAIDFTKQMAAFSMFRHAHETPLVSVLKLPSNTVTGFVFEVIYDKKRLSRTPFLDRALDDLRATLLN